MTEPRTLAIALGLTLAISGCSPTDFAPTPGGADAEEPESNETSELSGGTVVQAANTTCSTASVKGLALQVIAEANCIRPGAFAAVPARPNLVAASHVFLFLEQPARDRLVQALDARPGTTMVVNSMLRTLPQQYLLYQWGNEGACGIGLAAYPGESNHESGLAMDLNNPFTWRSTLENRGFRWFGSADEVHFDYVGSGAVDHRGLDVEAFQRLWNRNNPSDKIAVDGSFGWSTETRLRKSPAAGFALGASCGGGGGTPAPACQAAFDDICGSPYRADIEWLASKGIAKGCDSNSFCPDQQATRADVVAMLAAGLKLPTNAPDAFVDDETSPAEAAINAAHQAGFAAGCSASPPKFCPTGEVSRAVLASFFAGALNLPAGPDAFTDDETSPFEAAINAFAKAGFTSGCAVGKFCPNDLVTRGQLAHFARAAFE